MEWLDFNGNLILATEFFRTVSESYNNLAFIGLQNCLIKSKNGKLLADKNSWIFYSDGTPNFLDEQDNWEIIVYDIKKGEVSIDYLKMIEDIIAELNRDIYVIIAKTDNVIPTFLQFSGIHMSAASYLMGANVAGYSENVLFSSSNSDISIANKGNLTGIYPPNEIFPPQPYFVFPKYQALYLTIGQPNSGRREFFESVSNIVEVEKKGNWENKIRKNLSAGYSVVLQAMNQSRTDRAPAIAVARLLQIPVIILWFSVRGKPFEKITGESRPAKVYEKYVQSFQEPLKDEGFIYRVN